jgi:hypothetical protein
VGIAGFCGRDGVRNDRGDRRSADDQRGAKRSWWCRAQRGVLGRWWVSGCELTRRGAADGWGSAHRGAARSAGFWGVGGYRGANRRAVGSQTGANRRIAVPQTGANRRVVGPQTGAMRTWRGGAQCGVAWRWWAGWPASPVTSRLSPSPVRRFWTAPTPIRAKWGCELPARRVVWPRAATTARDGSSCGHQRPPWPIVVPARIVSG